MKLFGLLALLIVSCTPPTPAPKDDDSDPTNDAPKQVEGDTGYAAPTELSAIPPAPKQTPARQTNAEPAPGSGPSGAPPERPPPPPVPPETFENTTNRKRKRNRKENKADDDELSNKRHSCRFHTTTTT
jgi:hypothetical protein